MRAGELGRVELDRQSATVGDPVALTLHFTAPPTYRPGPMSWPYPADTILPLDTLQAELRDESTWVARIPVAFFVTGNLAAGPVDLQLVGPRGDSIFILFPPESLTVASVLPADVALDSIAPSGYKGLIYPPSRIAWWIWALLVVAALAAAGAVWWWRRPREVRVVPVAPARPPWEIALEALDQLEARDFHRRGDSRPFAIELSEIARAYLEARYGFEALEQTTGEIQGAMRHLKLSDEQRDALIQALQGCDLAKYARFEWPAPELLAAMSAVRRFVQNTTPRVMHPVEET